MNVKKMAAKDAAEFARAQMFYGEGAGTRRKLIKATVDYRAEVVPGYLEAYADAYLAQDMSKHADKAITERVRKNLTKSVGRNVRGIVKGDKRSMTTKVACAVVIGTWVHQNGYDEPVIEYTKKGRQVKDKIEVMRFKRKVDKVHNITSV